MYEVAACVLSFLVGALLFAFGFTFGISWAFRQILREEENYGHLVQSDPYRASRDRELQRRKEEQGERSE